MKLLVVSTLVLASALAATNANAEMNPNVNDAWKLIDIVNGGAELVFEPKFYTDAKTNLKWMVAVSCDPNANACAKFKFNVDNVQMTKVGSKDAKAFLAGDWGAF